MKDAYRIVWDRWLENKPLKVEEFTIAELEDAMSQGCSNRDFSYVMHTIAKQKQKLEREKLCRF